MLYLSVHGVRAESYAPGFGFSCHRCSGQAGKSAVGIGVAVLFVLLVAVALILKELVREVHDGTTENITDVDDGGGRSSKSGGREGRLRSTTFWERWLSSCRGVLVKAFPLTSFKTVVVVWQIITQVQDVVLALMLESLAEGRGSYPSVGNLSTSLFHITFARFAE